jgi:methionyl-tRNA synthetase
MPGRHVLVCVAWPYANGGLHLGHVAGSLLPPDIFARYHRLRGRHVLMVSGSDMHGTPITVAAEKAGVPPERFAEANRLLHNEALRALGIHFDLFTSTATGNHREVVWDIFETLLRQGHIYKAKMTAPYDPKAKRFLPDRYVEGTCPHCGYAEARGDQCDKCGRTLDPQELKDARSKLSGAPPEYRETEHFFLKLSAFEQRLRDWVTNQAPKAQWRPNTVNFTQNWLTEGLKDRPITRDMTYGVPIPPSAGTYAEKRIYVWFEAVIGYLSASIEWATKSGRGEAWKDYWLDPEAHAHYFLGKDNIPFHTIVWPAMILGYGDGKGRPYNLPWDVPANEFLQFAGAKFSKSRGNAFYVLDLMKHFDADQVRYYLAANMPERGDTDWTWPDFVAKVNDELADALGNYVNRLLSFCQQHYRGAPDPQTPHEPAIVQPEWAASRAHVEERLRQAAGALEACEFKEALRHVMQLARIGNQRFNDLKPWELLKQGRKDEAGAALLWHLSIAKTLSVVLQPFLPHLSESIWHALGEKGESPRALAERTHADDRWPTKLLGVAPGQAFGEVRPLVRKLEAKAVLEEFQPEAPAAPAPKAAEKPSPSTDGAAKPVIPFEEFQKLDLRVGQVLSVENHPQADKLYVLKIDIGGEVRQVVAGMRAHYKPEELVGKQVALVANLAPAKIRGVESQGMIFGADDGSVVSVLRPDKGIKTGARIR